MDLVQTDLNESAIEFTAALVLGLGIASGYVYIRTGVAPDLPGILAFAAVFAVTWYGAEILHRRIRER